MTTALRTNTIQDEYERPVPGASVYVYNADGSLAALTSDGSTVIANPLTSDAFGNYSYYALVGYYREDVWFGGKLRWSENNVAVGSPGADLTLRSDLTSWGLLTVTPQQYGAKADGVTDDYAAFAAAFAALPARGGSVFIPRGYYRLTQKIVTTKQVRIYGEGWSQNPGTVGVTSYIGFNLYTGSIIVCDADVGGIEFVAFTDNASNATAFEFQSSLGSVVQDVMLYSLGGTGAASHGIESYVVLNLDNVRVEGFAGYGVKTAGDGAGTANQYGNAALSSYRRVSCRFNKLSGLYTSGGNSSVMHFIGCDSANNGGVGFLDKTPFGNTYLSCHASANNASFGTPTGYSAAQRTQNTTDWAGLSDATAGSYVSTDAQGFTPYLGCYTELDTGYKAELSVAALVIGGILSTDAAHTAASAAPRFDSNIIKNLSQVYSGANGIVAFTGSISVTGGTTSSGPTSGIGYATGAGGAVTQLTSRTTGVTLNKTCGAITLFSAAGTATWQSFTVTNSTVAATDMVRVVQKSGTDLNMIHVTNVAAGSFKVSFATTGGTTTEQPVFNFAVFKAVAA